MDSFKLVKTVTEHTPGLLCFPNITPFGIDRVHKGLVWTVSTFVKANVNFQNHVNDYAEVSLI